MIHLLKQKSPFFTLLVLCFLIFLAAQCREISQTTLPKDLKIGYWQGWYYNAEIDGDFPLKIWYPSYEGKGNKAYLPLERPSYTVRFPFDTIRFQNWYNRETLADARSPVPSGTALPCIWLLHSYEMMPEIHTDLIEFLVQNGWAVIAPEFPSVIDYTEDKQGQSYFVNKKRLEQLSSECIPLWEPLHFAYGEEEKITILNDIMTCDTIAAPMLREQADIIQSIIEQLKKSAIAIHQSLRLDSMAVIGYFTGGMLAGQLAHSDTRFKAAINIDGFPFGDLLDQEHQFAYLNLAADEGTNYVPYFFRKSHYPAYFAQIDETKHYDFCGIIDWKSWEHGHYFQGKVETDRFKTWQFNTILQFINHHHTGQRDTMPIFDKWSAVNWKVLQ